MQGNNPKKFPVSQNYRMVCVERNLKNPLVPSLCPGQVFCPSELPSPPQSWSQ